MNSEQSINSADLFLREIPNVKVSFNVPLVKKKVKAELHCLRLDEEMQEQIMDTLKFIYGPKFKLKELKDYENNQTNLSKNYWIGQGNLVVKGGCDFSKKFVGPEEESDRLKEFALLRLESYGFHKNHCIEALRYCEGNVEDSLYILYNKYFQSENINEIKCDLTQKDLLEMRIDEKSSLQSIYENTFQEKVTNEVWILTVKLDYLIKIFHNKESIQKRKQKSGGKKEKCRNIIRGQRCKFGDKCRFSHEIEQVVKDPNAHLKDFTFDLEIRIPPNSKYPYEAPLILLKTNAVLPPMINLHICKRLYQEASNLADDGIPSIYSITELLKNEEEITFHLNNTEMNFFKANEHLFIDVLQPANLKRPTHYKKGETNRDNKRVLSVKEMKEIDEKLSIKFAAIQKSHEYDRMLTKRKVLPAWALMNNILNTIRQSQVVVISGETGCGKSTQIPQFILDEWLINYQNDSKHSEIVCTQPRRISAIGVAERVAEERCEKIGNTVGYQIRLESKMSPQTRLTFCTTGILLRRLESEPYLPQVTHIIVDEVHERSEESDFLLLILKEMLPFRPDLKIILMSATMNAKLFSEYFNGIPIINIPGRTFPVHQMFLEDVLEQVDYVLDENSEYVKKIRGDSESIDIELAQSDVSSSAMPNDNIKDENLKVSQIMMRYKDISIKTCKKLFFMDPNVINNDLIESILLWIVYGDHKYPNYGTILIFLPGISEITALYEQLQDHPEFGKRSNKYWLLPLHSSLTSEEQALIFKKPPNSIRKIVLSTNIAETSVTIDDCVFVIDSGKMKEKHFDPNRNMESLETVWVTKANALQRKGRAGRVMSGVCIHLFTNHRFKHQMLFQPIPEIRRIPLEQLILNIKVLQNFDDREVNEVLNNFIEPPVKENIDSAIIRLQNVGALDKFHLLTPLGHHLAALPVDVRVGKLMLYGAIFGCVDSALTMAACLSYKSPFVCPFGKRDEANAKKQKFAAGFSDHISVLMAYKKWLGLNKKSATAGKCFANENFLSYKTLLVIADIKYQFLELLVDIGFVSVNLNRRRRTGQDDILTITGEEFNKNGQNVTILESILCSALYPNVIKILTPSKTYIVSAAGAIPKENEAKDLKFATINELVFMHPSSVNYKVGNFPSPYLVYQEKVRTSKVFFKDCTMIPVIPLVLFSGFDINISVRNGYTFISLENDWILFEVEQHKVAEMIKMIRHELFLLLEEKIKDPLLNLMHHEKGEKIINTILNLINSR